MTLRALIGSVLLSALAGCGRPDATADLPGSGRAVDSILPREEAVRRFREGLSAVDSLRDGATSRDELVVEFVRAVAEADTAAIARLAVSRAEFAYLYYPTAVEGKPPYDVEPGLLWFMVYQRSNEGARKALTRYGGRAMTLVDYDCGAGQHREGENTVYGPCTVRWTRETGDTVSAGLFSKILERDGRFKVLSYANKLG